MPVQLGRILPTCINWSWVVIH